MKLVLPSPPMINSKYRTNKHGKVYVAQSHKSYVRDAQWACIQQTRRLYKDDVTCKIDWYRPSKRGDVDGIIKTLLDALQGYAYVNDNQVKRLIVERFEDPKNPRVEIEVTQWK